MTDEVERSITLESGQRLVAQGEKGSTFVKATNLLMDEIFMLRGRLALMSTGTVAIGVGATVSVGSACGTTAKPYAPLTVKRTLTDSEMTAFQDAMKVGATVLADEPAGKYDNVLRPFVALMERELHANSHKGDRPGWLSMSRSQASLEIYHHATKLANAMLADNPELIKEHAADVANMAMMALDVCGGLVDEPARQTPNDAEDARKWREHAADLVIMAGDAEGDGWNERQSALFDTLSKEFPTSNTPYVPPAPLNCPDHPGDSVTMADGTRKCVTCDWVYRAR